MAKNSFVAEVTFNVLGKEVGPEFNLVGQPL